MSKDAKNVPALRFKGYSDAWEKRKLGDIFYQVSFFVNPEDAKLELWSLTVAEGLTPKSIRYDRNFLVRKQDKFKVVHSEDFVYNPMNITLGALDQNKLLKSVAVSGYYTTMSINRGFDGSFFKFLLSSPLMIRKYKNYATGSLLEKQRVQFSTFSIINIKAPKFDEQNKIGNFLIKLDHLIAATQHKIDAFEQVKKALLQQLFDQSWRFKGYSDPWEKRKLSRGMDEYTDRVFVDDSKVYNQVSVKNIGEIELRGSAKGSLIGRKRQAKINLDDHPTTLVFTRQTIEQGGIGFAPSTTNGAIVTENMPTISVNVKVFSKSFLSAYFKTSAFRNTVILPNIKGGTAQVAVHESDVLASEIQIPKLDEQNSIGRLCELVDNLIAATQSRLSSLELLKKSLLQDLFI